MVWVRPGVLLVFAILSPMSELIRLDFPTLERPRKAISGALGAGNCLGSAAEVTNRVTTFISSIWRQRRQRARSEDRNAGTRKIGDGESPSNRRPLFGTRKEI